MIANEVPPGVDPSRWQAIKSRLDDGLHVTSDLLVWAMEEIQYQARTRIAAQNGMGRSFEREDKLKARVKALEAELAAYKRAKQENDERFMLERDDARAEAERLRAALVGAEETLRLVLDV
jgi:hypothetical protein